MRIVEINTVEYGSTGNIARQIALLFQKHGNSVTICTSGGRKLAEDNTIDHIHIGNRFSEALHIVFARLTGFNGCLSFFSTIRFIRKLKKYDPQIIHLHNLHNCYINLPLFFRFIKKKKIRLIWTLHDCWAFTGQCPHFTMEKCGKWKNGCHHCPKYNISYPVSYVDRTKTMWKLKKKWFTGVKDMTIVTPSLWLAGLVKESFLGEYPVKVINNGIDLNVFKPVQSDFRTKHNLGNKFIVLGVAFGWGERKGLDVFIELAKRLDKQYQIVLVGTDDDTDKQLPDNIFSIHRTQNQNELVDIYAAADVFVNPTREENYPTVNMEAIACGTPVITFRTGGSPEIPDETCGVVVDCDDKDTLAKEIIRVCYEKPFSIEDCMKRSTKFNQDERFKEYVALYEGLR